VAPPSPLRIVHPIPACVDPTRAPHPSPQGEPLHQGTGSLHDAAFLSPDCAPNSSFPLVLPPFPTNGLCRSYPCTAPISTRGTVTAGSSEPPWRHLSLSRLCTQFQLAPQPPDGYISLTLTLMPNRYILTCPEHSPPWQWRAPLHCIHNGFAEMPMVPPILCLEIIIFLLLH
jgi:hypothetical protein